MTVRELNGWTPATVTYDAAGDVVSVTVTEPRFSPREVDLLIESRRQEKAPRGPHGHLLSTATDPDVQRRINVPLPRIDYVQRALLKAQERHRAEYGENADYSGELWRVEVSDE